MKVLLGIGCGVVGTIVVMMGACTLIVGKAAVDIDEARKQRLAKKAETLAAITVRDIDSETSSGWVTIRGRACNEGSEPAPFVKIGCDYLNDNGQVVNSDFTYASSRDGIQPGACKEFTLMERNSRDWERYRTYVMTD